MNTPPKTPDQQSRTPTDMSLTALLSDLAALLPERVRFPCGYGFCYFIEGGWVLVTPYGPGRTANWEAAAALEAVLREECEARGWEWMVQRQQGQHEAVVFLPPVETGVGRPITPEFIGTASTPAEALAAAVLAALKSEKGEE